MKHQFPSLYLQYISFKLQKNIIAKYRKQVYWNHLFQDATEIPNTFNLIDVTECNIYEATPFSSDWFTHECFGPETR